MAFPTLGIIDAFNRADENPLAGGWLGPAAGFANQLRITANVCTAQTNSGSSYWNTAQHGPDIEIYFKITTISAGDYFGWRTASPGLSTYSGYQVSINHTADTLKVFRIDAGVATQLGADISVIFANDDSVGVEMVGSLITIYRKPAAGSWGSIGTRTDSTYTGAGYLWLGTDISGLDDFGGGTLAAGTVPQFFEVGDAMLIR